MQIATNRVVDRTALEDFVRGKCLVSMTVDSWGPIATGGFPPRLADT